MYQRKKTLVYVLFIVTPNGKVFAQYFNSFGIETVFKLEQLANANSPILVTEFGITTEVSPLQLLNARQPIEMTELGIMIDLNPVQYSNA